MPKIYTKTTSCFINSISDRLPAWVLAQNPFYFLNTKPFRTGPISTFLCMHDTLYCHKENKKQLKAHCKCIPIV